MFKTVVLVALLAVSATAAPYPPRLASSAAVDVSALEAASAPAGMGRRLSTCPNDNYVDCLNGNVRDDSATSCADACNGGCCIGADACTGATACIEKNSATPNCDGIQSCIRVGKDGGNVGAILGGSCIGDYACLSVGYQAGTVGMITSSCTGSQACMAVGFQGGTVGDITNSCNGDSCCKFHCAPAFDPTFSGIGCGVDVMNYTCPTSAPTSAPSSKPSSAPSPLQGKKAKGAAKSAKSPKAGKIGKMAKAF